mmetsp:Transcript_744/g.994  ORF Transcript_744/g.994 Transcript_744/m.994 type:complete len:154 (+) Transcript_744:395-856(+)
MGCETGSVNILGDSIEVMNPVRNEDLKMIDGMTGNVGKTSAGALTVRNIPQVIDNVERRSVATGPANAMSNKACLVGGKERRGVIQPKVPSWSEGKGTGRPIVVLVRLAAIRWAVSCMTWSVMVPMKMGKIVGGMREMLLSLTTAWKKLGFRA